MTRRGSALTWTAAFVAAIAFDFIVIAPWRPAIAVVLLMIVPLFALVEHDRRDYRRNLEAGRRQMARDRARREACPFCWGTGIDFALQPCWACRPRS